VDSAELERLEFELAAAQTVLQDANLEEQFARLTTANSQVYTLQADQRVLLFLLFPTF